MTLQTSMQTIRPRCARSLTFDDSDENYPRAGNRNRFREGQTEQV